MDGAFPLGFEYDFKIVLPVSKPKSVTHTVYKLQY